MTDVMERNYQRTHWETFYHENGELNESVSMQDAN